MVLAISILLLVGIEWYIVLIIALPLLCLVGLSCFCISYVIKDDELGVKSDAIWRWYPIEKYQRGQKN